MKLPVLISGALCLGLAACASPNAGNPNGDAYAGTAGSVYDLRQSAPHQWAVSYNPSAIPRTPGRAPSGAAMQRRALPPHPLKIRS